MFFPSASWSRAWKNMWRWCASFRRLPRNGNSFFTMMSLHINNRYATKRGIGKKLLLTFRTVMLQEHVEMVAGDFNGASWRRPCGSDRHFISIVREAVANTNLPMPPGPTPLWGPGSVLGEWADVCGFLKPLCSEPERHVQMHGPFTTSYGTLGLREKDQSCHHEVWMHVSHANSRGDRAPRYKKAQRLQLKERTSSYDRSKERRRAH